MPIGEPMGGTSYLLHIDTIGDIYFSECQNLGTKNEVIEQKVTTSTGQVVYRKLPGTKKVLNIVLKRGLNGDMTAAKWRRAVVDRKMAVGRSNGTITVLNAEGVAIAQWALGSAWPSKLVSSITDSTEELTLAVESLTRL